MSLPIKSSVLYSRLPLNSLLALLVCALLLAYLVQAETPRGTLTGQVFIASADGKVVSPLPHTRVHLVPSTVNPDGSRRTVTTDASGRFVIQRVNIGAYLLEASARWHRSLTFGAQVEESRTTDVRVIVKGRTEPDINIGDRQASFSTRETPFIPIRGYVTPPDLDSLTSGTRVKLKKSEPMTVRLWRTRLSSVLAREASATALQGLDETWNGPKTSFDRSLMASSPGFAPTPVLVGETTFPVTLVDREGFYFHRVPLEAAKGRPGLYLAQFTLGGKSVCSYVVVSDMALVVKRAANQLLAYTVDVEKGAPVAGAEVRCYRSGSLIASSLTDGGGTAAAQIPPAPRPGSADSEESGEDYSEPAVLAVAVRGEDEAVVQRSYYWGGSAAGLAHHLLTDRTVYRPGDTIQYKGIVRTRSEDAEGTTSYTIPRNLPVTVEVRDPTGALVSREPRLLSARGTYNGSFTVTDEGANGSYSVITTLGGEKVTSPVMVASYRKPEFTVSVTPAKARYIRGDSVEMTVAAKYYFGTPVAGGKVRYYIHRETDWSASYGFSEDDLEDGESAAEYAGHSSYYGEFLEQGEATLDAEGRFILRIPAATLGGAEAHENQPQVERITVTASVEDDAGRMTEADGATRLLAGDLLVSVSPEGYLAEPGKPASLFATVRDADGSPIPGISVRLQPSYQRWNAEKNESITVPLPGPPAAVTGPDGRALFHYSPIRTGDVRITAILRDRGGRTVRGDTNLWVVSDAGGDLDTDYGDLSVLTDKKRYQPGETARILVNVGRIGQSVLLTVEGSRIYKKLVLPIRQRSTVVRLPIEESWGPNVTLSACYVRNKKFASSSAPLRVQVRSREVAVRITPDGDRYRPGDTVTYTVETRDISTGRPVAAEVALAVVDEAIYALRPDNPSALRSTFWPRRQNLVQTSFSFMVEYLGDADKTEPVIEARKKFRDTAAWLPVISTDSSGRATARVTLPDNLTTWRATGYAVTDRTAVGYGLAKVISTLPFFVRLETPRFLTGGDETRLLALVHNETGQEQTALVRLTAPDLRFTGEEAQTVRVAPGGVARVEFAVTPRRNLTQSVPLRLTAWTPKETGKAQFSDGIENRLPIRAYGRTQFSTFAGALDPRESKLPAAPAGSSLLTVRPDRLSLSVARNAVPAETRLTLRLTPSVAGALSAGLEYLIGFPYGCTEQTMSRLYPDLLAQRLNLIRDPAKARALPRMVRSGIARLLRFQNKESGGWGWWENGPTDPFMTAYVLIGLTEAREQGYPVEPSALTGGQEALAKELATGKLPPAQKPFALYALARSGYRDDRDNILHAPFRYSAKRTGLDLKKLPPSSLAYLTLLARRLGEDHRPAYNRLQQQARVEGRLIHWGGSWSDGYGDSDRMATATALRAILEVDPGDGRIPAILQWLMRSRTDSYFGDTRDTAWVLTAFCDYLKVRPEEAKPVSGTVSVVVNGQVAQTVDLIRDSQGEPEVLVTPPADLLRIGSNVIELRRVGGEGLVFYSGALRQSLAAPPGQELPPLGTDDIMVKREFLRVVPRRVGESGWRLETEPVKDGRFRQGDQLRVRLTITAKKSAEYVLIEDFFPSGAEVTQHGSAETEVVGSWNYWYDHVDVRDDRVAFFARRLPGGQYIAEYNLRAQTPGVSRALPTHLEGMYDASVRAESASARIEVRP